MTLGWTLMGVGMIVLAVLILTSGDMRDRMAGTGDRRVSRRKQLAAQRERIAQPEQRIADCPTCTPPLFPTDEQLVVADALAGPGLDVPAPVDDPMAWIHRAAEPKPLTEGPRIQPDAPAAETYEVADVTAETQPTNVAALRNAMGLGATQQMKAVSRVEPVPPVTWGVPAGAGSVKPEELSPTTGRLATVRVADAMNEAS